jgi:WXG100 family type VII secretion target
MDKVQMKYEELEQIATRLAEWSSRTQAAAQKWRQQFQVLQGGGWIGRGFDKFADESESELMPAMKKLDDVLDQVANIIRQSVERMQQAEEEARGRFNF